jgi:hypothetical protein
MVDALCLTHHRHGAAKTEQGNTTVPCPLQQMRLKRWIPLSRRRPVHRKAPKAVNKY